jgi:hypothetical protein
MNKKLDLYNVYSKRTGQLINYISAISINDAYKQITIGLKELNKENPFTKKNITIKYVKEKFLVEQ